MARTHKNLRGQGLFRKPVLIEDTTSYSKYFEVSQLDDRIFHAGKNGFLIRGTNLLKSNSEISIEILDRLNNPIFASPVIDYDEGGSRLVSVEVYQTTADGPANLVILGTAQTYADGRSIPREWQNKPNVRWVIPVQIETANPNTAPIRLANKPTAVITEKAYLQTRVDTTTVTSSLYTASLDYDYAADQSDGYAITMLNNDGETVTFFDTVNVDGIFTGSLLRKTVESSSAGVITTVSTGDNQGYVTASVSMSLDKVLNETTAITQTPIKFGDKSDYLSPLLVSGSFSRVIDIADLGGGATNHTIEQYTSSVVFEYVSESVVNTTSISSVMSFRIPFVQTSTGEIAKVKISAKEASAAITSFAPFAEFVPSERNLITSSSLSGAQIGSFDQIGVFTERHILDANWFSALFNKADGDFNRADYESNGTSLTYGKKIISSSEKILEGAEVDHTASAVPYFFGTKTGIQLYRNVEYTLKYTAVYTPSFVTSSAGVAQGASPYTTSNTGSLKAFLTRTANHITSGSFLVNDTEPVQIGSVSKYGLWVDSITTRNNDKSLYEREVNFKIPGNGLAYLRFKSEDGFWSFGNIEITPAVEKGFNPDEIIFDAENNTLPATTNDFKIQFLNFEDRPIDYTLIGSKVFVSASNLPSDGTDGTNAKTIRLVADGMTFVKAADGVVPASLSPDTIKLTATKQNTTATATWTSDPAGVDFYAAASGGSPVTTGDVVYLRKADFSNSGTNTVVKVILTCDGIVDTQTFVQLEEGSGIIQAILSNDSHVMPASSTGEVSNYAGSGTDVYVYEGAIQLVYTPTNPGVGQWSGSLKNTSNITEGVVSDSGTYATIGNHSGAADGTDVYSMVFMVSGSSRNGTVFTPQAKTQSLSKSRAGAAGATGGPGPGLVYRGAFISSTIDDETFYYTSARRDAIKYHATDLGQGTYYLANNATNDSGETNWTISDFTAFSDQFDSVATDLLLAQEVAVAQGLTLGSTAAFTDTSTTYNNSTTVTHSANAAIVKGLKVSGSGIPIDSYVASVAANGLSFVLNNATTGGSDGGGNGDLTFTPTGFIRAASATSPTVGTGFWLDTEGNFRVGEGTDQDNYLVWDQDAGTIEIRGTLKLTGGSAATDDTAANAAQTTATNAASAASTAQSAIDAMETQVVLTNTGMAISSSAQTPNFGLAKFGTTTEFYDGTSGQNVKLKLQAAGITSYGDTVYQKTILDGSGLTIYDDRSSAAVDVANFGSTLRIGEHASNKTALRVDGSGNLTIGPSTGTQAVSMTAAGSLTLEGAVTANTGKIGAFTLTEDDLYGPHATLNNAGVTMVIGDMQNTPKIALGTTVAAGTGADAITYPRVETQANFYTTKDSTAATYTGDFNSTVVASNNAALADRINGPGIANGTYVTAHGEASPNTVTLSQAATSTTSNETVTFSSVVTGTGFYTDGSGNFRVGGTSHYIAFDAASESITLNGTIKGTGATSLEGFGLQNLTTLGMDKAAIYRDGTVTAQTIDIDGGQAGTGHAHIFIDATLTGDGNVAGGQGSFNAASATALQIKGGNVVTDGTITCTTLYQTAGAAQDADRFVADALTALTGASSGTEHFQVVIGGVTVGSMWSDLNNGSSAPTAGSLKFGVYGGDVDDTDEGTATVLELVTNGAIDKTDNPGFIIEQQSDGTAKVTKGIIDGSLGNVTVTPTGTYYSGTTLYATDITIGEDANTRLDFGQVNTIRWYANSTLQMQLTHGVLAASHNSLDLGASGNPWDNAFVGTLTATNYTIGGHSVNDIDIGTEFTDADDHLMSAGAIKEKIETYTDAKVTSVAASTPLESTGGITPTISALTAAVSDGATTLVTGNDVYDWVIAQTYGQGDITDINEIQAAGGYAGGGITVTGGGSGAVYIGLKYAGSADNFIYDAIDHEGNALATTDRIIYEDVTDSKCKRGLVSDLPFAPSSATGTVDTTGTINATDFAQWNDANTLISRTDAQVRSDLDLEIGIDVQAYHSTLAAVANSSYTGDNAITTLGTIGTGVWQGSSISTTYTDANNYSHPTNYAGDDFSVDTGALSGATVVSDIDINITTDTSGHVSDANGSVSTRTLSKSDISLGNVPNTDCTNASNISSGTLNNSRLPAAATTITSVGTLSSLAVSGDLTIDSPTLHVDSSANEVGIGTTSPSKTFHVVGDSYLQGNIFMLDTRKFILWPDTSGPTLEPASGELYVNNANLEVTRSGATVKAADIIATSDIRLKNVIGGVTNALSTVNKLNAIRFTWKDNEEDTREHIGFSAQDVLELVPEAVYGSEETEYAISYGKLVPVLVEAIKELTAEVEALKKKIGE